MSDELRILILEDVPTDAELMEHTLHKAGLAFQAQRVDTREGFGQALEQFKPDIVLADYHLPAFTGGEALDIVRRTHPEVPLIIVTGALGDEAAIELVHRGARDYVLKSNLARLEHAIRRALATENGIRARKAAEKALRENKQKMETLLKTANSIILRWKPDGTLIYVNDYGLKLFGYTADELIGAHVMTLVPQQESTGRDLSSLISDIAENPEKFTLNENENIKKNGERLWVIWTNKAIRDDADKVTEILAIGNDVTERRRQAERTTALLELSTLAEKLDEKALLQRGLDTMQHLTDSRIGFIHFVSADQNEIELVTWSSETLELYCTANFERHYPVAEAGIWADCIRLKQAVIVNDYATAPGKKGLPEGDAEMHRFVSVPLLEDGQVRMIVGVGNAARDYGERDVETIRLFSNDLYHIVQGMRAEQALLYSEKRYRQLFENMSSGVAIYQPDAACETFTLKSINRAVESIEHVQREEVVGRNVEEAFPGVSAFGLLAVFQRVCHSGAAEHFPPAFYQDQRIAGWRDNTVYRLETGEVVAVYDDVTVRVAHEAQINDLNRVLHTLSACNIELVHAQTEEELFQNVCRHIVETGGHLLAWVAFSDKGTNDTPIHVAHFGNEIAYQLHADLDHDTEHQRHCLTIAALHKHKTQVCNRLYGSQECSFGPLREAGVQSILALPLLHGGTVHGVLTIFSSNPDTFSPAEIQLMEELAGDIAYGIAALRTRSDRKQAELELSQQLDELRRWHDATLGRELRSIELKREVNELLSQAGQPPRYPSAETSSE